MVIFDKLFTELILESPQLQVRHRVDRTGRERVGGGRLQLGGRLQQRDAEWHRLQLQRGQLTRCSPASYWSGAAQFRITAVPEPAALLLAVMGLTLLRYGVARLKSQVPHFRLAPSFFPSSAYV